MTDSQARALDQVRELVRNFKRNESDYLQSTYNETQARTDFITPLLEAFGWDVHNTAAHSLALREVIEEATVEVGEERLSKKPDYELRLARQRKIFVEAKKPSVRIDRVRDAAFQARRYGYSASLPIVILTNFHYLAIYDCVPVPASTDEAHVSRLLLIKYDEFESRFNELWPLLSREAIYAGDFDRRFSVDVTRHGAQQFDDYFLQQVRTWRERLARDIHSNCPTLTPGELTYAVQLFLSRLVFLRICEDREIERYETLKNLPTANTFAALTEELRRADAFYDSGLFQLLDDTRLGIRISDRVLQQIVSELYYPQSPYTFAVIETEVLGEIYEQFLGEEIRIANNRVEIVYKPEIRASGGVVPTPRYIVEKIVERTLTPVLEGKSPEQLESFTVADICCGSGIFLLAVYESLLSHYLAWYTTNNPTEHIGSRVYETVGGQFSLTFSERRKILIRHIRGVDIDSNAVEVARFSLLLKLIEGETQSALLDFVERSGNTVLPSLTPLIKSGNSLVSHEEWSTSCGRMSASMAEEIKPFTWSNEFQAEMARGGFDVVVANPPYIRIQNMTTYSPNEVSFYKKGNSPYVTAHQDNFDKYSLFVERSISILRDGGRLGIIIPHKFMTTHAGHALRELITSESYLESLVHFGVQRVFGKNVLNYTCILILSKAGSDSVSIERVSSLDTWRYGEQGVTSTVNASELTADNWAFASEETLSLLERTRGAFPTCLGDVADIFVGMQTSADSIYIFEGVASDDTTISLNWNGQIWPIEKQLLRPCLLDVPLESYSRPSANKWMIYPYEIVNSSNRERARLIQMEEMQNRFPLCMAYFTARRAELEGRNIVGGSASERQFYQFGRSQSLTKFNSPKIILPVLSLEPKYAFDDDNITVTGGGNGPYYLVRTKDDAISNFYLLAILNHPLSEAFIRTNTSTFQGGYYSHGRQFIKDLRIPIPTASQRETLDDLVRQIIEANVATRQARIPEEITRRKRHVASLRQDIEALVTQLFNLSVHDLEIVKAVPIPN
jgi:type I restriction-modification system DNA methylase subunit